MLRKALQKAVEDESLNMPIEPAITVLQQAKCMLEWGSRPENLLSLDEFEEKLVQELRACIPSMDFNSRSFVTARADMCRSYHSMRTSLHFVTLWTNFIKVVLTEQPQPVFFQEITDIVFTKLVQSAFPVNITSSPSEATAISYDDANVIHYVAGYVCRKTHNKIEHSSANWVMEVDRGGLWRVQEGTYMLFASMEEEVREHLQVGNMKEGFKEEVTIAVSANDDVLFHWCILTAEVAEVHCQNCSSDAR